MHDGREQSRPLLDSGIPREALAVWHGRGIALVAHPTTSPLRDAAATAPLHHRSRLTPRVRPPPHPAFRVRSHRR